MPGSCLVSFHSYVRRLYSKFLGIFAVRGGWGPKEYLDFYLDFLCGSTHTLTHARPPSLFPLSSFRRFAVQFTGGALSHARIVIHRAHHHFADSDLEGTLSIYWKIPNLYFTLVSGENGLQFRFQSQFLIQIHGLHLPHFSPKW